MTQPANPAPRAFWVSLGLGLPIMAWGVRLYLEATPDLERRLDLAKWIVGLDLAHDLLLAPAVVVVGYLVSRAVPACARGAVQAALIATGTVLLVGFLPLMGSAGTANATIQPIRYGPAIAAVIAVIWVGAAVAVLITTWQGRGADEAGRRTPCGPDVARRSRRLGRSRRLARASAGRS